MRTRGTIGAFACLCLTVFLSTGLLVGCGCTPDDGKKPASEAAASKSSTVSSLPAKSVANEKPLKLKAASSVNEYTYEDMVADIEALQAAYPDLVTVDSLGTTEDGRELYHLVIGDDASASKKVFLSAGIHAREYRTPQITVCQAASLCEGLKAGDTYNGEPYGSLMQDVAVHVVPMINPDGIAIAQFGLDGVRSQTVKDRLADIAAQDGAAPTSSYFSQWKSNANGVDLNRNFDAMWDEFEGSGHPSSERYKGTAPGSEVESRALIDLTQRENFDCTVTYHSHGQVIYWYFAQDGELYDDTLALAKAAQEATGYALDANYESLDPAGYKDWCINKMGIPSLTIEVGTGDSPVPLGQVQGILSENEFVLEQVLVWLGGKSS